MTWRSRACTGFLAVAVAGCAGGGDEASDTGFTSVPNLTNNPPPSTMNGETGDPTMGDSTAGEVTSADTGETSSAETTAPTSGVTTTEMSASESSSSGVSGSCGDGAVDDGEECDDGNDVDTDACTSACALAVCGDGIVHMGVEGCDDGNDVDADECTNMCASAGCGDGIVAMGEACDDGNAVDTDACTSMCQAAKCGDGLVQAGVEQCDGTVETAMCNADCTNSSCGDGKQNMAAGEQCDDGNGANTDACVMCKPAKCGDGFVQAGAEQCDDGNNTDGDGCQANCTPTPQLPPECNNAVQLNDGTRNVNYGGSGVCDNPFTQQWYRFVGASGTRIPTSPPPIYTCNTDAPGWMNGPEPGVGQSGVDRQICFHWAGNTCNWSEPAKVTNCGNYYVYFLKNISWGCSGRYCGTN
ncbi:MAG: DUF4215 domain-containing protein [Myxococcales bacterium]|nr:DUF4215 domain-containing protein [Myxococcales bacterium]